MSDSDDKSNLCAYGWERLETTYPFAHPMFRIRNDLARWPDGHVSPYTYVQATNAVWIVPVTADDQIILIRQLRYTAAEWIWEVPAGGFHDFTGSPVDLARRELAEEIGGTSDNWLYVGSFRPGVSLIDQTCHILLAREVRLDQDPHREPGEIIEIHPVPVHRALEMARNGEMVDGHSALALLRCEPYLKSPGSSISSC
jgi:ADP-ribose pyrophosphatase